MHRAHANKRPIDFFSVSTSIFVVLFSKQNEWLIMRMLANSKAKWFQSIRRIMNKTARFSLFSMKYTELLWTEIEMATFCWFIVFFICFLSLFRPLCMSLSSIVFFHCRCTSTRAICLSCIDWCVVCHDNYAKQWLFMLFFKLILFAQSHLFSTLLHSFVKQWQLCRVLNSVRKMWKSCRRCSV